MSDCLKPALSYAEAGRAVFPLRLGTKLPATPNGFKDATTDPAQVMELFKHKANVAIATGAVSDIVVLDVDLKHGGPDTLAQYEDAFGSLPLTYTVKTAGGGAHYYFQHPGFEVRNRAGFAPGLDIRGDGGYVVAPPSRLTDGGEYRVVCDAPPAKLPQWLLDIVKPRTSPTAPRTSPTAPGASPVGARLLPEGERGQLAKATLQFILEGAPGGRWHADMYKACMDLKQQGYSFDEAYAKLESAGMQLDSSHDIPLLEDVYANREPKHPPRLEEKREEQSIVVRASELSEDMLKFLADKDTVKGKPTGLAGLDVLLGGGKRLGEVTCWHAEAKTGKNTLWHKLMYSWLTQAEPVAMGYASRELTPETEVLPNLLSLHTRRNAWLAEVNGEAYCKALAGWPLWFARGYGYFPMEDIKRWMDSLQELGVEYFWFDHLHYMLEDPEDHKAASKLIKEIKTLAKERNVHVDIIIQPNKLADGQQLSLNSIKGGAAMGQAIDNLLVLERVKGERDISKLTLRAGRSKLAKLGHLYLQYDHATTDFTEVEEQFDEGTPPPPTPGYVNGRSQGFDGSGYRV